MASGTAHPLEERSPTLWCQAREHLVPTLLCGMPMVASYNGVRCIRRRVCCLLALGVLVGTLVSCGYTLVGAPPDTPGHRLSLAIVPFTNQTREPDLERLTTTALRQSILQSQIFSSDEASSRRLQGAIRRLRSFPLSFDQNDNVLQYRIEADFHIRLVEAATQGPTIEQDITAWADYLVSATTTGTVVTPGAVREDVVADRKSTRLNSSHLGI